MPTQQTGNGSVFQRIRKLLHGTAVLLLFLVCLGAITRLTVADRFHATAILYYPTPPAAMVLVILFAIAVVPRSCRRPRRIAMVALPVAVAWTGSTQWTSGQSHPTPGTTQTCRMMFWNVCEGKRGWPAMAAAIQQQQPDVVALAEADTLKTQGEAFFAEYFPEYERLEFPGRLLLLSRLPIIDPQPGVLSHGGIYQAVKLQSSTNAFTLVFADISSTLRLHRKEPIETLTHIATGIDGPVVIAGDLNTPVDSEFFRHLRDSDFVSAFEASGHGLHTTWPVPLPVLAIDHIWGNRQIQFHRTQLLWTFLSDHRPIVADFTIAEAKLHREQALSLPAFAPSDQQSDVAIRNGKSRR